MLDATGSLVLMVVLLWFVPVTNWIWCCGLFHGTPIDDVLIQQQSLSKHLVSLVEFDAMDGIRLNVLTDAGNDILLRSVICGLDDIRIP